MPSRSLTQRYTSDCSVRTIKGPHCLAWPTNLTPLRPAHSSCRRRRSQWLLMITLHHPQHNDPLWRLVMNFIWENLVLSPPSLAGIFFTRGSLSGGICGFQSSIWQICFVCFFAQTRLKCSYFEGRISFLFRRSVSSTANDKIIIYRDS